MRGFNDFFEFSTRSLEKNVYTPKKINMEPRNHPIEKENHLNQTIIFRFHVNLRGCRGHAATEGVDLTSQASASGELTETKAAGGFFGMRLPSNSYVIILCIL